MRALLIVGLLSATAHADRTATVHLGGQFGGTEEMDPAMAPAMRATGGPRMTLAWEHQPISLPTTPGYNFDVTLVPELTGGVMLDEMRGESFAGFGLRGELRFGQREQGLLRVSGRGSFYLAGRMMLIGEGQDGLIEGALGTYLYLGASRARIGVEIAVAARERTDVPGDTTQMGVFSSLYLGWAM